MTIQTKAILTVLSHGTESFARFSHICKLKFFEFFHLSLSEMNGLNTKINCFRGFSPYLHVVIHRCRISISHAHLVSMLCLVFIAFDLNLNLAQFICRRHLTVPFFSGQKKTFNLCNRVVILSSKDINTTEHVC